MYTPTGDPSNMALWILIAAAAVVIVLLIIHLRRH